jgi:hypothetical protein
MSGARVTFHYGCDEYSVSVLDARNGKVWTAARLQLVDCGTDQHGAGRWCEIGGVPRMHATPRVLKAFALDLLDSGKAVWQ